jgi:hypothetical protein
MDEAAHSVHQAPAISHAQRQAMGRAVRVLAQQRAIKATKRAFPAQGVKIAQMSHREIVVAAEEYLAKHRAELINEARAIVDHWQAEGVFGKRGGIHLHRAKLSPHAQREKA